jgi:hypothetical protein
MVTPNFSVPGASHPFQLQILLSRGKGCGLQIKA